MHRFDHIKEQNPNLFKNDNKKFIIMIVFVAVASFLLGYDCCKFLGKESQEIQYQLIQNVNEEYDIKDVKPKGKAQELMDFQDMDKKFYTYLQNCEQLNIKTKNGYIQYLIEGKVEDKCSFKHRQIGFMDTICNLPMDVAKKYSEEGMNMVKQLEDLRAQNKSGFVDASQYINDINNDKAYCRYEYYERKNKS